VGVGTAAETKDVEGVREDEEGRTSVGERDTANVTSVVYEE
jgi:hypothetical protein